MVQVQNSESTDHTNFSHQNTVSTDQFSPQEISKTSPKSFQITNKLKNNDKQNQKNLQKKNEGQKNILKSQDLIFENINIQQKPKLNFQKEIVVDAIQNNKNSNLKIDNNQIESQQIKVELGKKNCNYFNSINCSSQLKGNLLFQNPQNGKSYNNNYNNMEELQIKLNKIQKPKLKVVTNNSPQCAQNNINNIIFQPEHYRKYQKNDKNKKLLDFENNQTYFNKQNFNQNQQKKKGSISQRFNNLKYQVPSQKSLIHKKSTSQTDSEKSIDNKIEQKYQQQDTQHKISIYNLQLQKKQNSDIQQQNTITNNKINQFQEKDNKIQNEQFKRNNNLQNRKNESNQNVQNNNILTNFPQYRMNHSLQHIKRENSYQNRKSTHSLVTNNQQIQQIQQIQNLQLLSSSNYNNASFMNQKQNENQITNRSINNLSTSRSRKNIKTLIMQMNKQKRNENLNQNLIFQDQNDISHENQFQNQNQNQNQIKSQNGLRTFFEKNQQEQQEKDQASKQQCERLLQKNKKYLKFRKSDNTLISNLMYRNIKNSSSNDLMEQQIKQRVKENKPVSELQFKLQEERQMLQIIKNDLPDDIKQNMKQQKKLNIRQKNKNYGQNILHKNSRSVQFENSYNYTLFSEYSISNSHYNNNVLNFDENINNNTNIMNQNTQLEPLDKNGFFISQKNDFNNENFKNIKIQNQQPKTFQFQFNNDKNGQILVPNGQKKLQNFYYSFEEKINSDKNLSINNNQRRSTLENDNINKKNKFNFDGQKKALKNLEFEDEINLLPINNNFKRKNIKNRTIQEDQQQLIMCQSQNQQNINNQFTRNNDNLNTYFPNSYWDFNNETQTQVKLNDKIKQNQNIIDNGAQYKIQNKKINQIKTERSISPSMKYMYSYKNQANFNNTQRYMRYLKNQQYDTNFDSKNIQNQEQKIKKDIQNGFKDKNKDMSIQTQTQRWATNQQFLEKLKEKITEKNEIKKMEKQRKIEKYNEKQSQQNQNIINNQNVTNVNNEKQQEKLQINVFDSIQTQISQPVDDEFKNQYFNYQQFFIDQTRDQKQKLNEQIYGIEKTKKQQKSSKQQKIKKQKNNNKTQIGNFQNQNIECDKQDDNQYSDSDLDLDLQLTSLFILKSSFQNTSSNNSNKIKKPQNFIKQNKKITTNSGKKDKISTFGSSQKKKSGKKLYQNLSSQEQISNFNDQQFLNEINYENSLNNRKLQICHQFSGKKSSGKKSKILFRYSPKKKRQNYGNIMEKNRLIQRIFKKNSQQKKNNEKEQLQSETQPNEHFKVNISQWQENLFDQTYQNNASKINGLSIKKNEFLKKQKSKIQNELQNIYNQKSTVQKQKENLKNQKKLQFNDFIKF
ncbi:hypothetical protein PPERSA_04442 [Pseudocohnilembus persalinus]|uniref:Uncharacterized protein n=1 Tax=Pseudocohnilembus persalinus TaxID=266149 RepID=A0A0V0QQQ6_PSEPJ|nr:hypothetical protein PPERSA_04442 [Pseudocohnilembus persalinus]|eukprot:KRX04627.1 hypothetical protein PPERSA_04442 [Pseudocohnilembus persalinus]